MRTRKDGVLGVAFTATQMRLVEIQGRMYSPQVLHAGIAPMPEGAFSNDRIVDPEAVGIALRRLLDGAGVTSRDAVFGLASGSVITQVMNVPFVPDNELQAVLEGELEHYKIMRHGESAFDYLRLNPVGRTGDESTGGESPMLLMAADKNVIATYQRVAELANLNLLSLEPTLIAMYRVGWLASKEQTGALCLSVDHTRAELAFVEGGAIQLYRRIDVGSETLFPSLFPGSAQNSSTTARARPSILGEEEEPSLTLAGLNPTLPGVSMNMNAARAVAVEVRRSIEYYRREHPNSVASDIVLVSDVAALETMAPWLEGELERNTALARPSLLSSITGANILKLPASAGASDVEQPELALLPALGLAMGLLPDPPANMPRFNLTSAHRMNAIADAVRRALLVSAAASAAILLFGGVIGGFIFLRAHSAEQELDKLQADYSAKQQKQNLIVSDWQRQQNQLTALQKKGYPFPRLMDAITNVVPPQAGLTEVSVDGTGRLTLTGKAVSDLAVVQTLDGLRAVDWFVLPTLENQERRKDRNELPSHVDFKISTQLTTAVEPPARATGGTP